MGSTSRSNWRGPRSDVRGESGQEKINLVLEVTNGAEGKRERTGASVFVTVDTSGSMAGSKLAQVVQSMREIIDKAPDHARFSIRTFSTDVKVLVTKKKYRLIDDRTTEGIRAATGGMTALYDAIGATIKEIPYKAFKTDRIYILVFTDGEENASKKETIGSVMEQIEKVILEKKVIFTFIQAGTGSEIVEKLEELKRKLPWKNREKCNILKVSDSANGIKIAFEEAQKQMRMHLKVELYGSAGLASNLAGLKISTGPTQPGGMRQALPKNAAIKDKPHTPRNEASGREQQEADLNQVASRLGWATAPAAFGPPKQDLNNARDPPVPGKIHIRNIPIAFPVDRIVNLFAEWGPCRLGPNGVGLGGRWAVLYYDSKDCAEAAVKEGNNRLIYNQRIVVNEYS